MEPFLFGSLSVFKADDLRAAHPEFFAGSATNRKFVEHKKILPGSYHFASHSIKHGWKPCSMAYVQGKLLLSEAWVRAHVPGMAKEPAENEACPAAPPVLALTDAERFQDAQGKPLDIETRGERHFDRIFFKVADVARAFDLPDLMNTLAKEHTRYETPMHYMYFYAEGTPDNVRGVKRGFLTYLGMVRVLMVSRSLAAERFQRWAIALLFAAQMGSSTQRQDAAAGLLGVSVGVVRQVLGMGTTTAAIYLFALGKVRDLRATMGLDAALPDDALVFKYGRTDDLGRRAAEHQRDYGRELRLTNWAAIDPDRLTEAEAMLRELFLGMGLSKRIDYDERRELIVATPTEHACLGKYVAQCGELFSGRVRLEAQRQQALVKDLQHALEMERKEKEHVSALLGEVIEKQKMQIENEQLKRQLAESARPPTP